MEYAPQALIDLAALRHNLIRARIAAPNRPILAVIKANGYGHGLLRTARALAGTDAYAVARLEEGILLREADIDKTILVMQGAMSEEQLEQAVEHELDLVVHHRDQIGLLEAAVLDYPLHVWMKVDSGMHRLGIPLDQACESFHRLNRCPNVAGLPRLLTHFACADDRLAPETAAQIQAFKALSIRAHTELSLANSAGVLGWPASHSGWIRPGIMLYGASPFLDGTGRDFNLKPAMTLMTRLIAINHHRQGERIGYGATYACPADMPVGVASIGYGDGYPRHAPSGTPVLVRGRRAPLAGRVSMDMISIDLRDIPNPQVGDPVILWGEGLPIEEVARPAGTIPYELLCGVTQRVRFLEVGEDWELGL